MVIGRPPKAPRSAFGQKLVTARVRLGLSQSEVASRVGVSQQAYAGWERRTVAIRPENIVKVAGVLGVDIRKLLGGGKGSVAGEMPTGRLYRLLLAIGRLSRRSQQRILGVAEDLVSAERRKGGR